MLRAGNKQEKKPELSCFKKLGNWAGIEVRTEVGIEMETEAGTEWKLGWKLK